MIAEAGKSKICKVGQQVRDPGKSWCFSSSLKAIRWWNFFLIQGRHSFYIKAFEWLEVPTHITEGNQLYSKTTDSNVNSIQKTL